LLNVLSSFLPNRERIVTIEDAAELQLHQEHIVRLEARPPNIEGRGEVTIRDLVRNSLRMRPDRIVVGECRGAEALDMLQAMNTGHDGSLTTLHANSPEDAVLRLMTMVRYAAELPVDVIERQVASAIDLGIQITRDAAGKRFVSRVVEYRFDHDAGKIQVDPVYERGFSDAAGLWKRIPAWIEDLERRGIATRQEVGEWKQLAS
jgi:pilus assembly protein CpaF